MEKSRLAPCPSLRIRGSLALLRRTGEQKPRADMRSGDIFRVWQLVRRSSGKDLTRAFSPFFHLACPTCSRKRPGEEKSMNPTCGFVHVCSGSWCFSGGLSCRARAVPGRWLPVQFSGERPYAPHPCSPPSQLARGDGGWGTMALPWPPRGSRRGIRGGGTAGDGSCQLGLLVGARGGGCACGHRQDPSQLASPKRSVPSCFPCAFLWRWEEGSGGGRERCFTSQRRTRGSGAAAAAAGPSAHA